ncbi:hypothetical protein L7F22_034579 [Adiantum nelumboides]|nr:hypothetical protein [Adiantum nelumboides]
MGGYLESKGAFIVSLIDLEGEETPITQERIDSWDDCWKTVNERMNDYAYVPTTFGGRLFQLRRLGEADKTTLLDGLAIEDRAWVEKEMQVVSSRGKRSWFTLLVQIMAWLLFKDEMEQKIEELAKGMDVIGRAKVIKKINITYREKTSKYARIADPTNGEKFCVEGGIKSTNAMNEQPGLHNAAHRVVYRWLLKEIAEHMLDEMPPLASVCTYADNPTFMYSDVKLGRSLSTIEKAKCPWWLDMVKNHVPDEELELFQ